MVTSGMTACTEALHYAMISETKACDCELNGLARYYKVSNIQGCFKQSRLQSREHQLSDSACHNAELPIRCSRQMRPNINMISQAQASAYINQPTHPQALMIEPPSLFRAQGLSELRASDDETDVESEADFDYDNNSSFTGDTDLGVYLNAS
ncbi:hypothetical protein B0T21DRAFT_447123 [Apiosordaria backusii]|uniref:Uncharacterized protein n=1 Tax=Apiosordaria backusii TaxID=314023 RepID=A0AA40K7M3_9PEZI|nr:hypothetical protein B0T21DRAFT_447123 [Apiosordaria backusii]